MPRCPGRWSPELVPMGNIQCRHPDVTLISIPLSLTLILSPALCPRLLCAHPAKYECKTLHLPLSLLWAAAANQQQQQDFLFTAFVSKPSSPPQYISVHLYPIVAAMYIHEVGGHAAFVHVRPAYIRTRLPANYSGPFTTTTPLPAGAEHLM